jgi:hypothetical protein
MHRVIDAKGNVDRRNEHFVGRSAEMRTIRPGTQRRILFDCSEGSRWLWSEQRYSLASLPGI